MAGPLLVVDTPWLLYRAFFALPKSIVDGEGRPVGALLGTVNAILAAVAACDPRAVVACFGREDAPYRVELYPPYHAHRDPMPEALADQWARAPGLLEAFGWRVLDTDELEADDLLYSLARTEEEAGGETLILTADRDLFQAVGPKVAVLQLTKDGQPVRIGPEEVRRRYGVGPEHVPDFIALRGDPSDGLPGAKGIGPKTARDLLLEHGSLEEAIARSHRERPRVGDALRTQADELRAFRTIATLVRVPVKRPPDAPIDFAGGARAASEYGMRRLAARLERMAKEQPGAGASAGASAGRGRSRRRA
jgi:DNA polymerase-1